ncbi:MAG: hypothetical protein D6E12_04455 [Desulfovibrio sp.]|nr:MAG: hypothetical protein D6E12_04455 [Desulfovibrio sp.]
MAETKQGLSRRKLLLGFAPGLVKEQEAPASEELEPEELTQGVEALEAGDFAKAVDLLRPFVKENKGNVEARAALGLALFKSEQYVQAKVEFDRLVYGGRRDKLASLYQGLCLLKMDKADKAADSFRTYVNPDDDPVQDELYAQLQRMASGSSAEEVSQAVEAALAKKS